MRKGEIILTILEKLKNTAVGFGDLFEALLNAGYGASMGRIDYELSRLSRERDRNTSKEERERIIKERYYKLLSKLEKDGLIKTKGDRGNRFFNITKRGLIKLVLLKEQKQKALPPTTLYHKESADKVIIVAFDIPEIERRKRAWLRAVLKKLGLEMVQKSVWFGRVKLPKEFLDDVLRLRIIDYLEIFEVTKTGSLKHIV